PSHPAESGGELTMFARYLLVLSCLLGAAVVAAGQKKAGNAYQVDTKTSQVFVKVGSATRLGHPHGVEGGLKSGELTLGGTGTLVFDMASFTPDTPPARTRLGLRG